ncbi:MAG: hypothetical protein Q9169_002329 [Polycauliona sp. 2 TL-2023]
MTRYSHPSSVRSEGNARVERSLRYGKVNNSSAGDQWSDGDDSPQLGATAATQPSKALRKEISHLREKVIMTRLELRERRVGMRQQHGVIRNLETRLLKLWRTACTDPNAIPELHSELCIALDKLGPMEVDYDEREDGLDTLEFDLEAKEARFYEQDTQADNDGHSSPQRSSIAAPTDDSEQDFLSPQYLYYSRIGDAQIARERLMDLEAQKDKYLDTEREREALGVPLYQENIDFLSRYDNEHAQHQQELEKIEREIQSLEVQVGPSNADAPVSRVSFHDLAWEADVNTGNQQSSEPGQARRSRPSSEEYARRKSENDILHLPKDNQSSRDRINQWILERLENSRFEQALHKAELDSPELDNKAWWSLVRQFWQLDRAARSSQSSSRHASGGASISAKAQTLGGSFDLDLSQASIALQIETQGPSNPHQEVLGQYADEHIDQLNYLDLAARPLAKYTKTPGKWDSILGC